MNRVELHLALPEGLAKEAPSIWPLIALTDALHRGALSPAQTEIVHSLREGLSLMAEREVVMVGIKVPLGSENDVQFSTTSSR